MHRPLRSQIVRLAACLLITAAILLLGAHGSAWATSSQSPDYQTVPTRTPGGFPGPSVTPTRKPTARPKPHSTSTPSSTPTSTPVPGANATPTSTQEPGEVEEPVGPGRDFTLGRGPWWVVVTSDDFAFPGKLVLSPPPGGLVPPIGQFILGGAISVNFYDANGNLVEHPTFANPILLCRAFTPEELAQAGNDRSRLSIQYFDTATSSWVLVPGAADQTTNQICVSLNHLTTFALVAKSGSQAGVPVPASLPNTSGQIDPDAPPAWLWAVIGLLAGAGVALVARQRLVTVENSRRDKQERE